MRSVSRYEFVPYWRHINWSPMMAHSTLESLDVESGYKSCLTALNIRHNLCNKTLHAEEKTFSSLIVFLLLRFVFTHTQGRSKGQKGHAKKA